MFFGQSIQNLPWLIAKGLGRSPIQYGGEETDSAANFIFWFQRHDCHSTSIVSFDTGTESTPKGLELTIFSHSLKEKQKRK